ncbi:hypothetical protein DL96DRAFT_1757845 [Flagelloscypha sp. PMI_526]|nr:hypothetical protein DL96DRAFT_1757845 [Flagelloscypha sp. PMI_526]
MKVETRLGRLLRNNLPHATVTLDEPRELIPACSRKQTLSAPGTVRERTSPSSLFRALKMSTSAGAPTHITYHNAIVDQLQATLGTFLLGYLATMVLYGFTSYQVYIYYATLRHESGIRKYTIALLALIDSASVAIVTNATYIYMIEEFIPTSPAVHRANNMFITDNILGIVTVFIVQIAYAGLLKQATGNLIASIVAGIAALGGLVLGILMSIHLYMNPVLGQSRQDWHEGTSLPAVIVTGQGLTFVAALITFIILHVFSSSGIDIHGKNLEYYWDLMIDICFERGLLAATFQLLYFIIFLTLPASRYWIAFELFVRRLFFVGLITRYINHSKSSGTDSMSNPSTFQPSHGSHAGLSVANGNVKTGEFGVHSTHEMSGGREQVFRITRTVEHETFHDDGRIIDAFPGKQ